MRSVFLLIACLTLQDLKNEGCRVWCAEKRGSAGGYFKAPGCACVEIIDSPYVDLTRNRVNLGPHEMEPIAPFKKDNEKVGNLYVNPWSTNDF